VTVRPPPDPTSTLWDFPSQAYGRGRQGDKRYGGVTPSYVIHGVVSRYTKRGDTVVDPMCGSGTTLDVCKDLGRRGLGFDLQPTRPEIRLADARHLPLPDGSVDLAFVDPPYSTHLKYSGDPRCLGERDAGTPAWAEAMEEVVVELARLLRPGGVLAVYLSDSFRFGHQRPFLPLGFHTFAMIERHLEPLDVVAVVRHHKSLKDPELLAKAKAHNAMLRGFNYLLLGRKPAKR
jgi:adenine-specific DNA-methyltransferase